MDEKCWSTTNPVCWKPCLRQDPKKIVIAGALDWACDLSGILKGIALEDKTRTASCMPPISTHGRANGRKRLWILQRSIPFSSLKWGPMPRKWSGCPLISRRMQKLGGRIFWDWFKKTVWIGVLFLSTRCAMASTSVRRKSLPRPTTAQKPTTRNAPEIKNNIGQRRTRKHQNHKGKSVRTACLLSLFQIKFPRAERQGQGRQAQTGQQWSAFIKRAPAGIVEGLVRPIEPAP